MRNLKKVLTLVLTLAMMLSIMVVGTGAAFTDQDAIVNTEAVNTCSALNIINGYQDNSFQPNGNITRAEMCKMIGVALNGGRELTIDNFGSNIFSDTQGHWASAYIGYCVRNNIVSGIGDNLFAPDGYVTGTQAAKMLLVAMGYNPVYQGYVNTPSWELNINSDAYDKGLYVGLETIDATAPLTRDSAAQLIYNGLDATMVKYESVAQIVDGNITMVPQLKDLTINEGTSGERKCTILADKYGVKTNYGQLVDVDGGKLKIDYDANYANRVTGQTSAITFSKVGTDYTDLLGQTVKVMYKDTDDVMGVAPVDGNKTYTVTASEIKKAGDKNEKVKFNDTEYKIELSTSNGAANTKDFIATLTVGSGGVTLDTTATADSLDYDKLNPSYDTITFVDNDNDGTLEYAVITKTLTGKVTYTNSDEIIAAGVTYDRSENRIGDGVAKDEYVTVTYDPFAEQSVIDVIAKATAKASINAANDEYMFDGTWYKQGPVTSGVTAGTNYDYWTYNGVMVAVDQVGSDANIDNLVMVLNMTAPGALTNQARIMFADGTKKNVDVVADDYDATGDVNFGSLNAGELYLATETSDGWTFEDIDDGEEIGDYTWTGSGTMDLIGAPVTGVGVTVLNNTPISDDAVVFVYGGTTLNDGKILTGKELKTITPSTGDGKLLQGTNGYFTSKVNGLTRASIVAAKMDNASNSMVGGNVTGGNYGLIVSDPIVLDGNYVQYTMWDGSKNVVVKEKGSTASLVANRPQFTVIDYDTVDSEGVISGVDVPTLSVDADSDATNNTKLVVGSVFSTQDDKLWYSNDDNLKLTSDTVYMYYDSSTTTAENIGKTQGTLVMADEAAKNVKIPNVKFIGNASGEVEFVLIDVKNAVVDDLASVAYGFTAATSAANFGGPGVATATFSKTSDIRYGETLTLTIEVLQNQTLTAGTYSLTNAKNTADGTEKITVPATTAPADRSVTLTYTVAVTATGASIATTADR